ncbi:hypothetical protein C8N32_10693 [Rhodovulum imhoffii]|uniref:Copper(I)-binding protein n=1 Tax=Rhodovulum imhoffii TaxID=365340 RepID=A0A2T5BT11_9RHOB|nr:copper chaperone PCu(A)C [Rhodovulum imhoffii]MBK5932664.1 copper-binding protein [Rhodovulum imhoffii]PTN02520.1 hypothetical protein C8N32_10693 [Rhodovulum imhoffii]
MSFRTTFFAVCAASFAVPVLAQGITIEDAYARASTMMSQSGAAFMTIANSAEADDRLVSASSDVAKRVELHTHVAGKGGVMQMVEVEEGFVIPAQGRHVLERGGDHVMFLGLNRPLEQGDTVTVTLSFENAGDISVDIPVDLKRQPMGMKPMGMKMGN